MKIQTSVNVLKDILEKIEHAANAAGKTRNEMIILLIMEAIKKKDTAIQYGRSVQYQDSAPKENWERPHIYLSEYEREYLLDVRKFLKMSVSFLLAFAVREYLDEILKKLTGFKPLKGWDNYLYNGYSFSYGVYKSSLHLGIYWGKPEY